MSEPATPVTVTLPADWHNEITSAWLDPDVSLTSFHNLVESWAAPKCDCDPDAFDRCDVCWTPAQQADFEAQQLAYCEESVRASADPEDGEQCSKLRTAGSVFCALHTPAPVVSGDVEADTAKLRAQLDAWITTQWDEIGKDSDEYNGADWCRGGRDVLRDLTQFLAAGSVPVDPETTQPARGVRCCIGPFADGTHAQNCRDRCQDCGGDEAGPRRCRCRDTGPAGATQDGDQT